jgi:hypothetical protein
LRIAQDLALRRNHDRKKNVALSVAAGSIARRKGLDFWKAFLVGTISPVVLGVAAVLLVRYLGDQGVFYCGGVVSLAVSLLIIIGYSFARRKSVPAGQA